MVVLAAVALLALSLQDVPVTPAPASDAGVGPVTAPVVAAPIAASAPAGPAVPRRVKVAVAELETGFGADPKLTHTLTALLTGELRKRQALTITSQDDIKSLLTLQKDRLKLNCSADTSCLAEIGGALGVDQMVTGSLGHVGESYLLDLRAIDVHKAAVLHEASRRLRTTDQDVLLDAIADLSEELYPDASVPKPIALAAAPPPSHGLIGPLVVGGSGVAAAIVGGILFLDASLAIPSHSVGTETIYGGTYAQAQGRNGEATAGSALFFGGLALGLAGLAWGLLQ